MGEIILLILKILLFTVLGILAFVFLILLLVMLVPIRYKIEGSMHEEKPDGFFEVSWLLKMVRARLLVREKKPVLDLRILYFLHPGKNKKEETEEKEEVSAADSNSEESPSEAAAEDGEQAEEPPPEPGRPEEEGPAPDDTGEEMEAEEPGSIPERIRKIAEKLKNTVSEKIEKTRELLRDLEDKKDFLTRDRVKAAIAHVLRMVMKMLKHLMPKSAKGDVLFGLESPADTGTVIGILSATMPVHKNSIRITPDFDRKVIEGEARISGRIFIGYLVVTAVRIILNRNVLYTLKNFKKHFSKKSKEE